MLLSQPRFAQSIPEFGAVSLGGDLYLDENKSLASELEKALGGPDVSRADDSSRIVGGMLPLFVCHL